ncbi:TetR/AcrR family transcriptional regulator [Saccharothrix sp. AJ9571]|uniref:TetR/AcrR family transcriptional regulator n=1 Tax=Amycolatopsis magusensis TaxID=882444 RepID=UPI003C2D878B|nr:TetR/AcrR family transcriptional regulator [Saccharothrix sp. AJ9571]
MVEQLGLRERKKQLTRRLISDTAIDLFLASGFDSVSVAEVADAAEVSKRTLFAYFPTKEDLVVHRFAHHEGENAQVVRSRTARQTPLIALRAHFLDGLLRRDPVTGLNDDPNQIALYAMVVATPSLSARLLQFYEGSERELVKELVGGDGADDLIARLAAAQIVATQRTLLMDNIRRLTNGARASDAYPDAVADARKAFKLLRSGLAEFGLG